MFNATLEIARWIDLPALILTNRDLLLDQAHAGFEEVLGQKIGVINRYSLRALRVEPFAMVQR